MTTEISKDEVLADFQACTGIDDIDLAIFQLEQSNWDLLTAINKALPQHTQTLPSEREVPTLNFGGSRNLTSMEQDPSDHDHGRMDEDDTVILGSSSDSEQNGKNPYSLTNEKSLNPTHNQFSTLSGTSSGSRPSYSTIDSGKPSKVSISSDFVQSGPSGSKKASWKKEIKFTVRKGSDSLEVTLADCETVDTLRTLIHAHFEIPPCQQSLTGWPNSSAANGGVTFGSLNLPSEVNLTLSSSQNSLSGPSTSSRMDPEDVVTLKILDETNSEDHIINFPISKTVHGVKEELYTVTNIPVRFQMWSGWPSGTSDTMTLNECRLDQPVHSLTIRKSTQSSSADLSKRLMELTDGSETSSDIEDLTESYPLEEDLFETEITRTAQKYMIADQVPNELAGSVQFSDNFSARYGACHPMFFQGSLEDAVKEACMQPAKNRKLLAIYLHHDGSVMSNVFCQQVLCNDSIVDYLTNNFIVWGWDVTNESNRQMLLAVANKNFGPPGSNTIRSIDRDRYPVIIIVSRIRATTEICSVIYGASAPTVDELMGNMINTNEVFQTQIQADKREEVEREARERVKREQDEAYEKSLIADRAKDEAKRALEMQKLNDEFKKQEAEKQAQLLREQIKLTLPPEPDSSCTDPVCSLKCRLPGGNVVSRKFLQTTAISVLFDFLFTQGFSRDEYKFLTTYPKRDLSSLPETTIIKNIFSPQDTLIVEER